MRTNRRNNIILIIGIFALLFTSGLINRSYKKPIIKINKQNSAINFNNYFLLFFAGGNTRLLADLFWITTLIESDLTHYKNNDLNSWMYLRFKTINNLDPRYLRAYQFGGKYLNIVKDDLKGAAEIFEAGLKRFPKDYDLNFDAGFLYAFELDEFQKAAELYSRIVNHPAAPTFLPTLINKLKYEQEKDLEYAYRINLESYKNTPEGHIKSKIKGELYSIKAEIDLKCLNGEDNKNCSRLDFEGNPYIYKDGSFTTSKPFIKYQLHFNKKKEGN
jgi:tetratricopeptide (TPR) repeat protein